jgi:hypothetical protein
MAKFDSKTFNPQAFGAYVKRVPNTKRNELAKSGAVGTNEQARTALSNQTGSLYATVPYFGRISGSTSQNNDGAHDIARTNTTTFEQGFVTASRMDAWTERSFSKNITAGVDFMDNVASQVSEYKFEVKQAILLAILKGVFSMNTSGAGVTSVAARKFLRNHVLDIRNASVPTVGASTLNTALQKAVGDNKAIFKLAIMHSAVATNLENLKLLDYLKYTDADGIQRDLTVGQWNGRLVLIDDEMPTEQTVVTPGTNTVKVTATATAGDKITVCGVEYTWVANGGTVGDFDIEIPASSTAGKEATAIKNKLDAVTTGDIADWTWTVSSDTVTATQKATAPEAWFDFEFNADNTSSAGTVAAGTASVVNTAYTTYVLGEGSVILDDIGDAVPYEMSRDPKTNGGQDTLYVRDRFICGVDGISFEKPASITASASNTDLANGDNWNIINDGATAIDDKAIAIAKIVSLG